MRSKALPSFNYSLVLRDQVTNARLASIDGVQFSDDMVFVERLEVPPRHRGKGYARQIMKLIPYEAFLLAVPTPDEKKLPLDRRAPGSRSLQLFYERLGFRRVSPKSNIMVRSRHRICKHLVRGFCGQCKRQAQKHSTKGN